MAKRDWKLLLIEDDEDDYLLFRETVSEIGAHLDWVSKFDEARTELGRNRHHAYFIDYRLGEHSGLDLIREGAELGCQAPMILLTGQGDLVVDETAMKSGAADYLEKGRFDAALLERSIRYALFRKRAEAALAKRARELAQSNATLREFADVVSEDLQDPLETMTTSLHKLQERCAAASEADLASSVSQALEAAEKMKELIEELTTFSRAAIEKS